MNKKDKMLLIKEYLYNNDLDENTRNLILYLYMYHTKLYNIQEKHNFNKENILKKLENQVYSNGEEYISDLDKIKLEIVYFKNTKNENVKNMLLNIVRLLNEKEENLTNDDILFMKKELTKIQILTHHDITFYEAANILFETYLDEIKEKSQKK